MTLRNILTVLVSLAWLAAQTVAVAGHCQGVGGSLNEARSAHTHDHAGIGTHDHHGTSHAAGSHDHLETHHHEHAGDAGLPHAPDSTQPSDECSVGYVALALQDVDAGDVLLPATLTGGSAGRPLNPHKTSLPTPPPNAIL